MRPSTTFKSRSKRFPDKQISSTSDLVGPGSYNLAKQTMLKKSHNFSIQTSNQGVTDLQIVAV